MKYEYGFILKINWEKPLSENKFKPYMQPLCHDIQIENNNGEYHLLGHFAVNKIDRPVWIHVEDIGNMFWAGSDHMDATHEIYSLIGRIIVNKFVKDNTKK